MKAQDSDLPCFLDLGSPPDQLYLSLDRKEMPSAWTDRAARPLTQEEEPLSDQTHEDTITRR
jgi:hypothetical protein